MMTVTVREIIILSLFVLVKSQYEYYRPGVRASDLGFNTFGRPFNHAEGSGSLEAIPGQAGIDYPVFSEVPETGFRCDQQRYPGYYADLTTGCQVFHICQRGGRSDSFLCPNGTIFNQEWFVCDSWYNFDCSRAESLYSVNEQVVRSMNEVEGRPENFRYNGIGDLDSQGLRNFGSNFQTRNQNFLNLGRYRLDSRVSGFPNTFGGPGTANYGIPYQGNSYQGNYLPPGK